MNQCAELAGAAEWLKTTRRTGDGSWGKSRGEASSIVSTAEALYVLSLAGADKSVLAVSEKFIREAVQTHPATRGAMTRYQIYGIYALLLLGAASNDPDVVGCATWLKEKAIRIPNTAGSPQFAWSYCYDSEDAKPSPNLFHTVIAVDALSRVCAREDDYVQGGLAWIAKQQRLDNGWGAELNADSTPSHTALAVDLLCRLTPEDNAVRIGNGRQYLNAVQDWTQEKETIGGVWEHCPHALVPIALMESGTQATDPCVTQHLLYFSHHVSKEGGWFEDGAAAVRTVRVSYWAAWLLRTYLDRLNPFAEAERQTKQETASDMITVIPGPWLRTKSAPAFVIVISLVSLVSAILFLLVLPVTTCRWIGIAANLVIFIGAAIVINIEKVRFKRLSQFLKTTYVAFEVIGTLAAIYGLIYSLLQNPSLIHWLLR